MRKKIAFSSIILLALLAPSCARKRQDAAESAGGATIRAEMGALLSGAEWAAELEGGRLSAGIARAALSSPAAVCAASRAPRPDGTTPGAPALYPVLDGFGSLDTAALPPELRAFVTSFCAALFSDAGAERYMMPESLFSLAMFYADYNERAAYAGNSGRVRFARHIVGEPFFSRGFWEIPVRFVSDTLTLDVLVFCAGGAGGWGVDQIQLERWGAP